MHILFISDSDDKYGASQSMKQLVEELLVYHKDIEISVILPLRSNLENYYYRMGCHVYKILYESFYQGIPEQRWKIPAKRLVRGIEYWIGRWTGLYCIRKKLDINTIDIIHSNSSREDFGAMLALKYQKPLIWHIREFGDIDYECFSFRKKYIEFMNTAASEFIAVSEAVKIHWIKKGLEEKKIIRIHNGVSSEITIKENYVNKFGKIKFIMLGSIRVTKGQYQIIQALGLLTEEEKKRITLDFIGGGSRSYIKELQKMVEKYGLRDKIRFLGYQKNLLKDISEYDCGIMCSKSEGFGRVTVEYMMAGLPVIASDTGANSEIVINNTNGFLYHWGDIQDLRDKISLLINHEDLIKKMGKRARMSAQMYFNSGRNAQLILNEYKKIMNKKD